MVTCRHASYTTVPGLMNHQSRRPLYFYTCEACGHTWISTGPLPEPLQPTPREKLLLTKVGRHENH